MMQEIELLERLKLTLEQIEMSFENDEYVLRIVASDKSKQEKDFLLVRYFNKTIVKGILKKRNLKKINKVFSLNYIEKNHVKINNLVYDLNNYDVLFYNNIYYKNKELLKLFIESKANLDIWFKKFNKSFFVNFLDEYTNELHSLNNNTKNIESLNYYLSELYKYNYISLKEILDKYGKNKLISYGFVKNIICYISFEEMQDIIKKALSLSEKEKKELECQYIIDNSNLLPLNYFLDRYTEDLVLLNYKDEELCYQYIKNRFIKNRMPIEKVALLYAKREWNISKYNTFVIHNIDKINEQLIKKILFSEFIHFKDKLNIISKIDIDSFECLDFLFLNATEDEIFNNILDERIYLNLSYDFFKQIFKNKKYGNDLKKYILFNKKIFSSILIKKNIKPELIDKKYRILKSLYFINDNIDNVIDFDFFSYEWSEQELQIIKEILKCQLSSIEINKIIELDRTSSFKIIFDYFLSNYNKEETNYIIIDKILRYFEDDSKYIYSVNTQNDKEVFFNIIMRSSSIYDNVVIPNYVVKINNKLNIEIQTNLVDYDKNRNKKCDQIFKKAIRNSNYFLAKNALYNKYFNMNIEEIHEFIRMFKKIDIKDNKNNNYYRVVSEVFNEFNLNRLEKMYNEFPNIYSNMDNLLVYMEIIKEINIELKSKLLDVDNIDYVISKKVVINNKRINVLIPKKDFYLLVHSTDAYNKNSNKSSNYKERWLNNNSCFNNGISCSAISNTYFGITHIKDVLLGFNKWNDSNKIIMAPYDMHSNTYNLVTSLKRPIQYMNLNDLINNSRHTHNEVILERIDTSCNLKIMPTYVIIFSFMKKSQKNKAISCANDFGIPIVFIEDIKMLKGLQKIIRHNQRMLTKKYDYDILYKTLTLFTNIKNGLREHYSLISEKYFKTRRLEKCLEKCYCSLLQKQDFEAISTFEKLLELEKEKFDYTMLATKRINYFYFHVPSSSTKNDEIISGFDMVKLINKYLKMCNCNFDKNKYTKSDFSVLFNGIKKVRDAYFGRTKKHNINHIIRITIYVQIISKLRNLSYEDTKILIEAALYHDIERVNDKLDKQHGLRSASKYLEIYGTGKKQRYIAYIIEYHEIPDNPVLINKLFIKYNIDEENYNQVMELAKILKDADALDRMRFSNPYATLNPEYLRLKESLNIIAIADGMCR